MTSLLTNGGGQIRVQEIHRLTVRLAQDRELCQRLGEAAYRKGAVKNTWQDYGDRLLNAYQVSAGKKVAGQNL